MKKTQSSAASSASAASATNSASAANEHITKQDIDDIKANLIEIKLLVKEYKKNLKGLVEIQQRLVHERLGVTPPPPPKEYGEEETTNKPKINITSLGSDRIRVAGNTFDFKSAIKDAGFAKWEQSTKSWSLPSDSLDQLIKNLEAVNLKKDADFSVDVTEEVKKEQTSSDPDPDDGGFGSGFSN